MQSNRNNQEFQHKYAATGDAKWAELLEKCAFYALPGAVSDDMWTHQYDQMSKQISCERFPGRSLFRTNNEEAHLFGLEPNYGCCTADFGQGWPKFFLSSFMRDGRAVENVIPVPSSLDADNIKVELDTDYPFKNSFTYRIVAKDDVTFRIRIPSFAENLSVNGEKVPEKDRLTFVLLAGEQRTIRISYDSKPQLRARPGGLFTAERGSPVFSVPVKYDKIKYEYERDGVERKFPYCDYEYRGTSPWNYAFFDGDLTAPEREVGECPFSTEEPPVVLTAKMRKINWGLEDGFETVCSAWPESTAPIGEEETVELYPYGCAKLRMTQIPLADPV